MLEAENLASVDIGWLHVLACCMYPWEEIPRPFLRPSPESYVMRVWARTYDKQKAVNVVESGKSILTSFPSCANCQISSTLSRAKVVHSMPNLLLAFCNA